MEMFFCENIQNLPLQLGSHSIPSAGVLYKPTQLYKNVIWLACSCYLF